jgi:hypothetical protein
MDTIEKKVGGDYGILVIGCFGGWLSGIIFVKNIGTREPMNIRIDAAGLEGKAMDGRLAIENNTYWFQIVNVTS